MGGQHETIMERLPWVLKQPGGKDESWCSPFEGLFGAMRQALATGKILTTSIHVPGAASEAHTADGLICGHEYGLKGVLVGRKP